MAELQAKIDSLVKGSGALDPVSLPAQIVIGSNGLTKTPGASPAEISVQTPFQDILKFCRRRNITDVHFSSGNPILLRVCGSLTTHGTGVFTCEQVYAVICEVLTEEQRQVLHQRGDYELVYVLEGYGRFRVTIMKKREGWDIAVRLIVLSIPVFESTGMPESCRKLMDWSQGMVLVTGPLGCGKTTTMATLVELINKSRPLHIITIEDPIEIVYTPERCQVSQRQVLEHTMKPGNALRAALREDPDVLVVSELRDLASIELAVTAAETGHLVLGTMNTKDSIQTILRVINSFPPEDRPIMQNMISETLRGVICQQLIPTVDGKGVVPAYEVLIVTNAVANIIRKGALEQLVTVISTGEAQGMISFDSSVMNLFKKGIISRDEAYLRCENKKLFELMRQESSS